jgi:multiple sugar transport system substrate-binding protein
MSTIYDVAKLANVSISTVSNYLNNKYIGPEKRVDIQKAIEQLGYVPNQSAKRLKTKKSNQVAVIIPNIEERIYSETLIGVCLPLEKAGYKTILYMTDDIDTKEERAISECLTSEYAGVIICTCNPKNTSLFVKLQKRTSTVFIIRKPAKLNGYNYIGFNDNETIFNITDYFLKRDNKSFCLMSGPLAYPNETECIEGYKKAFSDNKIPYFDENIINLPSSRESTFKVVIKKLYDGFQPKLILTTSVLFANALIEAAILRNIKLDKDINIISLGEDSWYNFESIHHVTTTNRPAKKLGIFASETLLLNIKSPKSFEFVTKNYRDDFLYSKLKKIDENLKRFTSISIKPVYAKNLKLLLTQNDNISDTIKYALPEFCDKAHLNVIVDTLPQTGIYEELLKIKNNKKSEYDVFAIDVPWLAYFSQSKCLMDLSKSFDKASLTAAFAENTLARFGEYKGKVYGIPYLNATQLLYYRKDVFDDDDVKKDFYTMYDKKLKPPKDWHEFNLVAKFFTKQYNENSPFEYGTSVTRGFHEALMGELYPRIWSYGGSVFDRQGRISVMSDENISAFNNMVQSLKYSDPALSNISAFEKTKRFAKGEVPMVIAYHHHACVLSDRTVSTVYDKIGYDYIPGETPILAGWTMGINNYSKTKDSAISFLSWLLNAQSSISYTVLGGNSAIESTYYNPDLLKLYPWFDLVPSSSLLSRPRNTPLIGDETIVPEAKVERILADVIFNHIKSNEPIEDLLKKAHEDIRKLFNDNGYKEPALV